VEPASSARLLFARPNVAVSVQLTALDVLLALGPIPSWKGGVAVLGCAFTALVAYSNLLQQVALENGHV